MRLPKHTQVFNRLNVVGLTVRDLHESVNERLAENGKSPCNYCTLSRALNGGTEPKQRELALLADSITQRWIKEYAAEVARTMRPKLEEKGLPTERLNASCVPAEDFTTVVIIRSGITPVATFKPENNTLKLIGE